MFWYQICNTYMTKWQQYDEWTKQIYLINMSAPSINTVFFKQDICIFHIFLNWENTAWLHLFMFHYLICICNLYKGIKHSPGGIMPHGVGVLPHWHRWGEAPIFLWKKIVFFFNIDNRTRFVNGKWPLIVFLVSLIRGGILRVRLAPSYPMDFRNSRQLWISTIQLLILIILISITEVITHYGKPKTNKTSNYGYVWLIMNIHN